MDELERVRVMKREIENNVSVLVPENEKTWTRRHCNEDAENALIQSLRLEKKLKWGEIADYLNRKRQDAGEAASLTEAKLYSRFVLHTTRTAVPVGEVGFSAKDYMHLRHPEQFVEGGRQFPVSKAGKKRIKDYEHGRELRANMRQPVGEEAQGDLQTVEKTEQLVEAVAKVERNFWKLVADEMERATTKLYKPEELASRYHAI